MKNITGSAIQKLDSDIEDEASPMNIIKNCVVVTVDMLDYKRKDNHRFESVVRTKF